VDWARTLLGQQPWADGVLHRSGGSEVHPFNRWFTGEASRWLQFVWLDERVAAHMGLQFAQGQEGVLNHFHPVNFLAWWLYLRSAVRGRPLEDILRFAEEVKDLDFEYYHVMPYHTLLSFERLEWFYRHIADRLAKPLWMYTSANWSKPFTPEFVASLKGHPNIAGVKYSTKDAVNILKVAALQDEEFQVITAVASQFAACLGMGVKGHTSSLGSAVPEAMIAVYKAFREQGQEAALQEQQRLNAFLSEWPKGGKSNNFLQAAEEKAILELRGICKRHTSSYYAEMDDAGVAALKRVMEKYGYPLAS
jgi:4-hydroxy-tetrahydrodipicolinate synthase